MKQKRLSMKERVEIWNKYQDTVSGSGTFVVQQVAREYHVSRPTIYSVLEKGLHNALAGRSTWLTPEERDDIRERFRACLCRNDRFVVASIAREFQVSRHTIYAVLEGGLSSDRGFDSDSPAPRLHDTGNPALITAVAGAGKTAEHYSLTKGVRAPALTGQGFGTGVS